MRNIENKCPHPVLIKEKDQKTYSKSAPIGTCGLCLSKTEISDDYELLPHKCGGREMYWKKIGD